MPRSKNFDANQHLAKALAAIDEQIASLQSQRNQLATIIGGGKTSGKATKASEKPKREMSAESRQKISDAQKKRWGTDKKKK